MIYLMNRNLRKKLSEHFASSEFECPCCGYALISSDLVQGLEKIRSKLGIPIKINSGYRCPRHNAAVGGAEFSRHLAGCAADITWAGIILNVKQTSLFRKELVTIAEEYKIYGIGWSTQYIHVDTDVTRKRLTQWYYDASLA